MSPYALFPLAQSPFIHPIQCHWCELIVKSVFKHTKSVILKLATQCNVSEIFNMLIGLLLTVHLCNLTVDYTGILRSHVAFEIYL